MKKIINNRIYDTATAALKASYNNSRFGDFAYLKESLYLKKTGEYFLHGEGGAQTRYAGRTGNMYHDGEAIIPVTYQEAQKWAEEKLSGDEYEAIFGAVTEVEGREQVNMMIKKASLAKAKRAAQEAGISLTAYIEGLIG